MALPGLACAAYYAADTALITGNSDAVLQSGCVPHTERDCIKQRCIASTSTCWEVCSSLQGHVPLTGYGPSSNPGSSLCRGQHFQAARTTVWHVVASTAPRLITETQLQPGVQPRAPPDPACRAARRLSPKAHTLMGRSWSPTAGVRRFITRAQVAATGMSHLVGTPLLRAYMHGYFVHQRLWQKAVGLAPGTSAAAAQRSAAVAQQLEAQRASRITLLKRLPKVGAPRLCGEGCRDSSVLMEGPGRPGCWRGDERGRPLWGSGGGLLGSLDKAEQGCWVPRSTGQWALVSLLAWGTTG